MHSVGPPNRRGSGLGEAEKTHLAGRDQVRHRTDGVLDRDGGIDPMLVVHIDVVHA